MKVTLVTHNVLSGDGQGRVNSEIVRFVLRKGAQVRIISHRIDADLKELGAEWEPIPLHLTRLNLLKVPEFALKVTRRLRPGETIHGSGYTLNRPHQVNTCHFVHHSWLRSPVHVSRVNRGPYGAYQGLYTRLNSLWERRAYRQAQVIVAVSSLVRQQLLDAGVSADRIRVIHNGVNTCEYHPGHAARQTLGMPDGVCLALFVGDIRTPRKNLDTVLRAVALCPRLHLAIAGSLDGSPYPNLAGEIGIADRVHFLGFRRDLAQIMRAVDLFVCPSRYEPFSLALLEAMASGLPVVTAACVGAAELVTPKSGFVLPGTEDAEEMACAFRTLQENPRCRSEMGEAGRAEAERYTWERMAAAYYSLYEETSA